LLSMATRWPMLVPGSIFGLPAGHASATLTILRGRHRGRASGGVDCASQWPSYLPEPGSCDCMGSWQLSDTRWPTSCVLKHTARRCMIPLTMKWSCLQRARLSHSMRGRDIDRLLEQLPERQRAPIEYVRLHGMSVSETARLTGLRSRPSRLAFIVVSGVVTPDSGLGEMRTDQLIPLLAAGLLPQDRHAILRRFCIALSVGAVAAVRRPCVKPRHSSRSP